MRIIYEIDPVIPVQRFIETLNSQDVEGLSAFFTDFSSLDGLSSTWYGKEQIQEYLKNLVNQNMRIIIVERKDTVMNSVHWNTEFSSDYLDEMGVDPMEGSINATVMGGKLMILSFNYDFPLLNGIIALSAFAVGLILSISVAVFKTKTLSKMIDNRKNLRIIPIIVLFVFIILTTIGYLNPSNIDAVSQSIRRLSEASLSFGFEYFIIISFMIGLIPGLMAYKFFKKTEKMMSGLAFSQKIMLNASVSLFMVIILIIILSSILYIVGLFPGIISIIGNLSQGYDLSLIIMPLQRLLSTISTFVVAMIGSTLSIWLSTSFLLIVILKTKSSRLAIPKKIILILGGLALFILSAFNYLSIFFPVGQIIHTLQEAITPLSVITLMSFLAAEGYIETIKENLGRLRHPDIHSDNSTNRTIKRFSIFGFIKLIIGIVGLLRGLLLITVLFNPSQTSQSFSPINSFFIMNVEPLFSSIYGINSYSAVLLMASFALFTSSYFLIDTVMILKGLGKIFLNMNGRVFVVLRKNIGLLITISFIAVVLISMSISTAYDHMTQFFLSFESLPSWVFNQIPWFPMYPTEGENFNFIRSFFTGSVTLLVLVFTVYKSVKPSVDNADNSKTNFEQDPETPKKICETCGYQSPMTSNYCEKCGRPFDEGTIA
jgi:ribosomal protein L40E